MPIDYPDIDWRLYTIKEAARLLRKSPKRLMDLLENEHLIDREIIRVGHRVIVKGLIHEYLLVKLFAKVERTTTDSQQAIEFQYFLELLFAYDRGFTIAFSPTSKVFTTKYLERLAEQIIGDTPSVEATRHRVTTAAYAFIAQYGERVSPSGVWRLRGWAREGPRYFGGVSELHITRFRRRG